MEHDGISEHKFLERLAAEYPQEQGGRSVAFCAPSSLKRAFLLFDHVLLWDTPDNIDRDGMPEDAWHSIDCVSIIDFPGHFASFLQFIRRSAAATGDRLVDIYEDDIVASKFLQTGLEAGYVAALRNLPVAVEERLAWKQVAEMRKDRDALTKYRRLRSWLESGLRADSVAAAHEQMSLMLDDYRWAMQKHGLKTTIAVLKTVLSSRNAAILAAGGLAAAHVQSLFPLFASGLLLGAEVTAVVAERQIASEDAQRGANSEVAYIYDILKAAKVERSS